MVAQYVENKRLSLFFFSRNQAKGLTPASFEGGSQTQVFAPLAYYRDIKPANLLISPQERDGTFSTKFTDFDSAKSLDDQKRVAMTTGVITPKYLDPALSRKKDNNEAVDGDDYSSHDTHAIALFAFEILDQKGSHLFAGLTDPETIVNMHKCQRDQLRRCRR